tara:strand:- start:6 stop:284 length:279 start_codon:yes stop_codon:yes gene_type:complete
MGMIVVMGDISALRAADEKNRQSQNHSHNDAHSLCHIGDFMDYFHYLFRFIIVLFNHTMNEKRMLTTKIFCSNELYQAISLRPKLISSNDFL